MDITSIIITAIVTGTIIIGFMMMFVVPRIKELLQSDKDLRSEEKENIKSDLSNKKDEIEKLIKDLHKQLETSNEKLEKAERERIGSFSGLKQELENQHKITEQLSVTTQSLNKLLSNNQMRGQFGEQVAEDLLKMSGFVKGTDYEANKSQESGEGRPDFTIFLPNKVKINIDCKFPYQNLKKMTETEGAGKNEYLRLFKDDVKKKIKEILGRNYINPQDNTVDFVIMFIPNEMIFSFIYDKMNDVWSEAMHQKVVFAGPFSFTAILRLVRQAYDNFHYQKNIQKIITQIQTFQIEFTKYNEEFVKIGDRIKSLSDQYTLVDTTRTNKLLKSVDKIRQEDTPALPIDIEK